MLGNQSLFNLPQNLEGQFVTLELLTEAHTPELMEAVEDGQHYRLWFANVPTAESMSAYVASAMAQAEQGNIAYAVRLNSTGQIVGTTRYYDVSHEHQRACIGYTWYANQVRRTAVNTECKLLLLSQLFEQENAHCNRTSWRQA
jgi:RimJ/RimL family protein N-acetyltransferase